MSKLADKNSCYIKTINFLNVNNKFKSILYLDVEEDMFTVRYKKTSELYDNVVGVEDVRSIDRVRRRALSR